MQYFFHISLFTAYTYQANEWVVNYFTQCLFCDRFCPANTNDFHICRTTERFLFTKKSGRKLGCFSGLLRV